MKVLFPLVCIPHIDFEHKKKTINSFFNWLNLKILRFIKGKLQWFYMRFDVSVKYNRQTVE